MNTYLSLNFKNTLKIVTNYHVWAIILLTAFLTILYYGRYFYIADGFSWFDPVRIFETAYNIHGSLFTIPFIYAAVVFGFRGTLVVWVILLAIILPRITYLSYGHATIVRNILAALIPLTIVSIITIQVSIRKKERKILLEKENERKIYRSQVIKAQENERRRVAQELHDDSLQTLVVIASMAEKIITHGEDNTAMVMAEANNIKDEALRLSEDMRRLCLSLRPSILDNGLVSALRWLANKFHKESGIEIDVEITEMSLNINPETGVILFRIIQEALNNIKCHSKATEVHITLEQTAECLRIKVQDNGKGFSLPNSISQFTSQGRLGLAGMQERAQSINGELKILSEEGKGTTVEITVKR